MATATKKTGLSAISQGSSEVFKIDPRLIQIEQGWNSRDFSDPENIAYVEGMADSIASIGVKQAVTVKLKDGVPYIRDGECRLRGTMLAIERGTDIKLIPVVAEDRYASDVELLKLQRIRNSNKPFTVFEDAKHFKRLLDLGCSPEEIARDANISRARVSQILDFNTVPAAAKVLVNSGAISATLAMQTVKAADGDNAKAVEQLTTAVATAAAEGRTKVKPRDVPNTEAKVNIKAAVVEAFEYADVDDSADDVVIVKFPADKFEVIRKLLGL